MSNSLSRRKFMKKAGAAAVVGLTSTSVFAESEKILVIGVSCSPRNGKTTATSIKVALDAAKGVNSKIETKLFDLGGLNIFGLFQPREEGEAKDDFAKILPTLRSPNLGGIIIGSPVYFRIMSSLCSADMVTGVRRWRNFVRPELVLANKPVGVLSVGAYRNGGQELVIQQIQTAMLCHEVMIVGGKPGAHQGATLWNAYKDDISKDEFGMESAKKLGIRVAEAALRLANVS
ncbi:flavodoxin family protein [Acidobacteriota bacterium]